MAESEYQSEKDRMLPKKKLKSLIERLREADRAKLQDFVKEIESGYHLKHFPERQEFWQAFVGAGAQSAFVVTLFENYLKLLGMLKSSLLYKLSGWILFGKFCTNRRRIWMLPLNGMPELERHRLLQLCPPRRL